MLELDRSRNCLVRHLVEVALAAGRALVRRPWGIGKTTLLLEAEEQGRASGLRTGYVPRTAVLADIVAALERAYGAVRSDLPARRRRSSLRAPCERDAGLLLLDGFKAWARLGDAQYWRDGQPLLDAVAANVRMQWLNDAGERDSDQRRST